MPLLKRHSRALRDSAISNEIVRARRYQTVYRNEAGVALMDKLGFRGMAARDDHRRPGLLIPVLDGRGRVWGHQYRPDHPRLDSRGKPVKYENPRGQKMRLDFPPGWMDKLADKDLPLIVTEGSKKADAATSAGYAAIAMLGVAIWKTEPCLEDWRAISKYLSGRHVFICFDSDATTKQEVHDQETRLASFLRTTHKARVHVCRLKSTAAGQKVGLDDFIAAGGDVDALLNRARPRPVRVMA